MRRLVVGGCLALFCSAMATGCCSTGYLALRTLVCEPYHYCFKVDKLRSRALYRSWAEQEWAVVSQSCAETALVSDYKAGFEEGFVEYVYAGGTGAPPPVPPREFWNAALRSENGKERANQWFQGYHHGAQVAADGGYREFGTVQTSFAYQPGDYASDAMQQGRGATEAPAADTELLPMPPAEKPQDPPAGPVATPTSQSGLDSDRTGGVASNGLRDARGDYQVKTGRTILQTGDNGRGSAEPNAFPSDGQVPQLEPADDQLPLPAIADPPNPWSTPVLNGARHPSTPGPLGADATATSTTDVTANSPDEIIAGRGNQLGQPRPSPSRPLPETTVAIGPIVDPTLSTPNESQPAGGPLPIRVERSLSRAEEDAVIGPALTSAKAQRLDSPVVVTTLDVQSADRQPAEQRVNSSTRECYRASFFAR